MWAEVVDGDLLSGTIRVEVELVVLLGVSYLPDRLWAEVVDGDLFVVSRLRGFGSDSAQTYRFRNEAARGAKGKQQSIEGPYVIETYKVAHDRSLRNCTKSS